MQKPLVVAIDGPSGVGKSSTARGVASRLGLQYLDTGAMYRAATVAWQQANLTAQQVDETVALIQQDCIQLSTDPENQWVKVFGQDVTQLIRSSEISAVVSQVATMIPVRQELARMQRAIIAASVPGIVAEGRDITTVIAPDATVRILLCADVEARKQRRLAQMDGALTSEQLQDQIVRRDRDDSTVSQFLEAASGVTVLDSTFLSLDEVIDQICTMVPLALA